MDTALTAALIAAAITAIGWLANHFLSVKAALDRRRHETRLAHVEKQLEQLYGPLLFLILEGKSAFRDFCQTLGRNYVFDGNGHIRPDDLKTWLYWVDNEFMPRNLAIQNLLASKAHLIVGERMPDSYLSFIDHYNSWRVRHLRWKEEQVPYTWHAKTNWPDQFDNDVIKEYEKLKGLQIRLASLVRGMEA
ncbi:hypothetical protein ACFO9E_25420 [Streptomyces maoxianensis]|uniref:DUF4760 domain-containing protein n=1 Tax=Streptomyces maoxianensis TaxID=1459942 RepID=A0ABV9GDJ9_9ACTN